ncbi:MAG TPA: flagellar hook-length control protein [Thermoanaerobaculia bacterium]|nr:flagellar hook-length control protein [Thermoanaerobaculia bacterium]
MRKWIALAGLVIASLCLPDAVSAQVRNGMTWSKSSHNAQFSTDTVGCNGCDAYAGETSCAQALPVLCLYADGAPNPGVPVNFYNGWARGFVYLTPPVVGSTLGSLANANALCAANFGPGYRMAEFHDGQGGWGWQAYGNVSGAGRFWVFINDQPANCWN